MKKTLVMLLLAVASLTIATSSALAQNSNPMVGGAAMFRTKDIVDNAVNSADHTTLVAAVKAAGLVSTLKGKGRSQCLLQPTRPSTSCQPERLTCSSSLRTKSC
jgi:uncharacterized surface protein with fasciclin (FAS1) repeats